MSQPTDSPTPVSDGTQEQYDVFDVPLSVGVFRPLTAFRATHENSGSGRGVTWATSLALQRTMAALNEQIHRANKPESTQVSSPTPAQANAAKLIVRLWRTGTGPRPEDAVFEAAGEAPPPVSN